MKSCGEASAPVYTTTGSLLNSCMQMPRWKGLIWSDVEYSLESTSPLQPCKQNHGLCQPFEPARQFQVLRLWFLHVHTSGCAKRRPGLLRLPAFSSL